MQKLYFSFLVMLTIIIASCGSKKEASTDDTEAPESMIQKPSEYDPNRGEGSFNADNIVIGATLDASLADMGAKIQGVKCASCHKLTDERLVGPGWKGVTERRKPAWIMNFISNPDAMIDKDPEVQAQLELCLVRMPNQNLSGEEARQVLEFMRKNDGIK